MGKLAFKIFAIGLLIILLDASLSAAAALGAFQTGSVSLTL
jgi:hypothetical protein